MSVIHLIDPLLLWLPNASWSDASQHLFGSISSIHFSVDPLSIGQISIDVHHPFHTMQTLLAQQFETDVFRNARVAFNNFIKSGQAWALAVGFVIGYIVRGLTTYG
ncbi:hypothetical protein [Leptolyngbya ohadii]|uniref:hypothetical protein n=1 Tax=Leptolyngbya ohadii TaxID=1962290 RepID=UPI00117A7036|nr:hypothetical protein [Leptolyngbya ohadii]